MAQNLKSIMSASLFEANAALRLHPNAAGFQPLCVEIGAEELRRHHGALSAVRSCEHDVLTDVLLSAIWAEVPQARAFITQLDVELSRRGERGE